MAQLTKYDVDVTAEVVAAFIDGMRNNPAFQIHGHIRDIGGEEGLRGENSHDPDVLVEVEDGTFIRVVPDYFGLDTFCLDGYFQHAGKTEAYEVFRQMVYGDERKALIQRIPEFLEAIVKAAKEFYFRQTAA